MVWGFCFRFGGFLVGCCLIFLMGGSRKFALLSLKRGITWNFLLRQSEGILLGMLSKTRVKHGNKLISREALTE